MRDDRTISLTWSRRLFVALTAVIGFAIAMAMDPAPTFAQDVEASIARGGRLYDKWYKVNKETPQTVS